LITAEQIDSFSIEGYLVIPDLLSPAEVEDCCAEVDRLHQVASELRTLGNLAGSSFQPEPHAQSVFHGDREIPVLRKIEDTGTHSDLFKQLARHPRVVKIAQRLLNSPDLLLFRSTKYLDAQACVSRFCPRTASGFCVLAPSILLLSLP
jgi:hypothetical protein